MMKVKVTAQQFINFLKLCSENKAKQFYSFIMKYVGKYLYSLLDIDICKCEHLLTAIGQIVIYLQRQGMSDLFIKHVLWYLSYNIRSIVATGLDRADPQDKL